jgi:hypothetical protein
MQGARSAPVRLCPAQGLAVDRHDARHLGLEAGHPTRKGSLERLRIERPQHPAQGLSRRDAMTKGEKPAKPVKLLLAEHRDLVENPPSAQKTSQNRQQHLIQRVSRHARNAIILNPLDVIQKPHAHRRISRPGDLTPFPPSPR